MKINTQFYDLELSDKKTPAYLKVLLNKIKGEFGTNVFQFCAGVLLDGSKFLLILTVWEQEIIELKFYAKKEISEKYELSDFPTNEYKFDWFCSRLEERGFVIENKYEKMGIKLTREEVRLLKEGKKLACVKLVKERTGLGLKESKELVDSESLIIKV